MPGYMEHKGTIISQTNLVSALKEVIIMFNIKDRLKNYECTNVYTSIYKILILTFIIIGNSTGLRKRTR